MEFKLSRYFMSFSVLLIIVWSLSCSGRPGKPVPEEKRNAGEKNEPAPSFFRMTEPGENSEFRLNDPVRVVLAKAENGRVPDSLAIWFDGKPVETLKADQWEYSIPGSFTSGTGRKALKVTAFSNGKARNSITRFVVVYSDKAPARFGYRVVNSFPHDVHAFTQGLFYDGGSLYEGTGQETGSSLREVELTTGVIKRQHNLESNLFGEGITLYDNRIYQVTWQNKVGFVYDKQTFSTVKKLYYNTEGWGLTTVNRHIVMSDGSNVLYFFDPEMFTVISRLEVYDNEKMVDQLNELEYIEGEIWANIWQSDLIARIDPLTGKVNSYVDLRGILRDEHRTPETDVLNGIAWDSINKRIFVTGKKWPRLFEIRVIR